MLSLYESLTPTVARLLLPLLLLTQAAGKTLQLGCCMEPKVTRSLLLALDPLGAQEVALLQEGLMTSLGEQCWCFPVPAGSSFYLVGTPSHADTTLVAFLRKRPQF